MRANRAVRLFWAVVLVVFGLAAGTGGRPDWPGAPVNVLAAPSGQASNIQITILSPQADRIVAGPLNVVATITSTWALATVTATVDDHQVAMHFSDSAICVSHTCFPGWVGTVPLTGLARGQKTLVVGAQDTQGGTQSASQRFTYDQPPTIQWTSPTANSVARPSLRFAASCVDDDAPNCTVNVYSQQLGLLVSGKQSVDQTLSLESESVSQDTIKVQVTDSVGQGFAEARTVYIETSRRLQDEVVVDGQILDADETRVLAGGDGQPVRLIDRHTSQTTTIIGPGGPSSTHGFLTSKGALFDASDGKVYEWRDGTLHEIIDGTVNAVKGEFALIGIAGLYDIQAGTLTGIGGGGGSGLLGADLAPNGDVVYFNYSEWKIYRWRNGSFSPLAGGETPFVYPRTDGINVVAMAGTVFTNCNFNCGLFLMDESSKTLLVDGGGAYLLANGFVAYTAKSQGVLQAWLREKNGQQRQLSFFGTATTLDTLSDDGDVVVFHDSKRFIIPHGQTLDASTPAVSGAYGRAKKIAGTWYVIFGNTLSRVLDQQQPPQPPFPTVNRVPEKITVTEGGNQTFAIGLNIIPKSRVDVTFTYDPAKITVSPPLVAFPADGGALAPQTVTVTAKDDTVLQGNRTVPIQLVTSSSDPGFNGLTIEPEQVTIVDNEAPAACSPRPQVGVQTARQPDGTLKVTVSATSPAGLNNALRTLTWTSLSNATVTVDGIGPVSQGQVTNLPTGAQTATFQVRRVTAGQPATVRFTVSDACGDWPTFVGLGAGT